MGTERQIGVDFGAALADGNLLLSLTALDRVEFERVLARFERLHTAQRRPLRIDGQPRRRAPMTGHKGPLSAPRAKLFFVLFYFRFFPSQKLMGILFGLSQGQVSRWLRLLSPIVSEALGREALLPAHRPANLARLLILAPGVRRILPDTRLSRKLSAKA